MMGSLTHLELNGSNFDLHYDLSTALIINGVSKLFDIFTLPTSFQFSHILDSQFNVNPSKSNVWVIGDQ